MKKIASIALSLALTASLAAPALATELTAMPISAPLTYSYEITVNGTKLDTAKLPMMDENYIPMRLVAESDHGSASWYAEENSGAFYMENLYVAIDFTDNAVTVGETVLKQPALVRDGVTYLPVSVFEGLEGYTLTMENNKINLVTPNNDPLVQLGYSIVEAGDMSSRMKSDAKAFFMSLNLDYDKHFEQGISFMGMNISPDTLVVGKLTKSADQKAVKDAIETYRKNQEDTFSWYLPQNLPKVQAAQTVITGDYILFVIADEADKAVETFNTWVAAQK